MIIRQNDLYDFLRKLKDNKLKYETMESLSEFLDKDLAFIINKCPHNKHNILRIGIIKDGILIDTIKKFKGNRNFDEFFLDTVSNNEPTLIFDFVNWFNTYDLYCYYEQNKLIVFKFNYFIKNNILKIFKQNLFYYDENFFNML